MASSYVVDTPVGGTPVSVTETAQRFDLGIEVRAIDKNTVKSQSNVGGGVFVYARGSNVTAAGQFVMLSQSLVGGGNSAVLLDSANSTCWWPIGVAAGNLSATNVFGWVQVQGVCDYALVSNTSVAANARLALGSTAGQVGSVTALGSRIGNINVPISFTSSQTSLTVILNRPFLFGVTASN